MNNPYNLPSKLLEKVVNEFSKLPGIGYRTALRLVLHLLKQEHEDVAGFGHSLINLRDQVKYCRKCHNISDTDICSICSDPKRDATTLCVVENIRDVMAIENTRQYKGLFHVLGGVISPMDGIGPGDIEIGSLEERIKEEGIKEIILALNTTMEGDTTNFYIFKRINQYPVRVTTLARGISFGDELEYTDEITLGRSIVNRTVFEASVPGND